jgi:hypothetical protein
MHANNDLQYIYARMMDVHACMYVATRLANGIVGGKRSATISKYDSRSERKKR